MTRLSWPFKSRRDLLKNPRCFVPRQAPFSHQAHAQTLQDDASVQRLVLRLQQLAPKQCYRPLNLLQAFAVTLQSALRISPHCIEPVIGAPSQAHLELNASQGEWRGRGRRKVIGNDQINVRHIVSWWAGVSAARSAHLRCVTCIADKRQRLSALFTSSVR